MAPPPSNGQGPTTLADKAGGGAVEAVSNDLVVEKTLNNGVEQLRLHAPGRPPSVLVEINENMRTVAFASPLQVSHPGPGGEPLTSWLLQPPGGLRPGTPLIVVGYPGAQARRDANPTAWSVMANVELLAGMGYAVLTPSLPRSAELEPSEGLTEQIVAVLDAALAQYPDLDPDRVGFLGHSFGGYAAMVLATHTKRFASIVAMSGAYDLGASWGNFSGHGRANQEAGVTARRTAGWLEQGQAALGAPPWIDPDAYRRNSPFYAADAVTAPVLFIHGELDVMPLSAVESMFSALWRQNKDAQLVTYWGEGHLVESAGNVRDLYERLEVWFARTLAAPATRTALDGTPSAEPRPQATRPQGSAPLPLASAERPDAGASPSPTG